MALEAASSFSSIHSADSPVAMAVEAASSFSSIHSAASPVAMSTRSHSPASPVPISTRSHSPASDFDRIQSPASSLDLFPSDVSLYICRCPSPCNLLRIHSPASSLDPAHSPASSFDHIHSVLKELETHCRARGLSQWVRRFKAKNDHDELSNSVCDNIKQLDTDWVFLIMFYESVDKWRKADDQGELKSNIQAIVSVASGIASDLRDARHRKKYTLRSRRALKLLKVLISDCQTKTEALMEEIGATVSSWSGCGFFLEGYRAGHHELRYFSNLNRYSRLEKLLESVIISLEVIIESTAQHGFNDATDSNLNKQIYAFYDDLKCIQGHLDGLLHGYTFSHGRRHVTEKFLLKIASVAIRTANCSCNYWFNKKLDPNVARRNLIAGLLDVQHQIGPTNSNFVDLSLHSLRNLPQISTCPSPIFTPDVFPYSLVNGLKNEHLEQEVKSLVRLVIGVHTAWRNFKIEQRFIGETSALLVEVASYHGKACDEAQTDCSVLLIKICLLKVELFLMDKLNDEDRLDMIQREVERLNNALETLSQFSEDLPLEKTEYGIQTLALIEEVASLYRSCLAKTRKCTVFKVNDSSFQLFYKIVFFKAESFLEELLKSNITNLVACGKDKIEVLLKELKFFKELLTYQNSTEALVKVFQQVEKVARRITFFSYSFHPNKITEMRIEEMITAFDELFDKLKCIKAELRAFCPRFPMPNVPKTCELLFIDFLINNIQELLKNDPDSIRSVKNPLTEIQQHLESLKSFLMEVSKLDIEHPELKDLGNNIMRVVHKLDYVIDIKFGADWQHFFRFYDILNELRLVSKQASQIQMGTLNAKLKNVIQDSCGRIPWDSTREAGNEVAVNLRDQEEVIIDQLTRGSSKRAIVSIVGMPGIGKTTLARQVYNCQHVMYHFHRRAWCTVSQVYEKRELLLEILSDICGPTDEIHDMSNAELELKLRQCLLRNKYLIVMDDVWDIGAWHDLQISFPDDSNGSRILITTRLCNVALETNPTSEPHHLRPFSDEESWKLLKVKIFQDEFCPEELSLVGREIARQCKGLPLAVVAISGLLKRIEKSENWWKKIAESLSSQIINHPEARCMEIMELSYRHLPEYLKACFLYLGAFPEDKDIPVTKLIRLWLAEGFILKTDSRSLELVAEDHLMDLINRSLVIISKRRSNGKVKACRLHDLMRDFCQSKAKEQNFLKLITRSDEPYDSFLSSDYGFEFEFEFDHHFKPITYKAYRLSIFLRRNHFVDSRPSGLGTRSLIFFAATDSEPRCPYDISFIRQNFEFLRVLDLECINVGISFPLEIGLLVQLRYLAVSGYVRNVPRSIDNLWKLETLVVKGFRGKVVLPDTIWHMSSLRHLHVNKYVAFNLKDEGVGSSFQLENLISFSAPALPYGEETEKILKRLPNLCKLRCIFWNSSKNCNQFPALNFLSHLESLRIFYFNKELNPGELILPLNLKKLTLSHFHLPQSHISAIGRLPKLEVLKLDSGKFEGRKWDMREDEFQKLKFLKLDAMDIAEWNASCDHLPNLERLVLQNCRDLREIPCDFAGIATLEMIEVHWCGQSGEQSAKEIAEASGQIKVLISHL